MSVVSCRFPNSITTTCYGLVGRVANKSATSWQLPRLPESYAETCVMDFGHKYAMLFWRAQGHVTSVLGKVVRYKCCESGPVLGIYTVELGDGSVGHNFK